MNRTQILDYQGKKIFFMDFSKLKTHEEIKEVILDSKKYIHAQPAGSVYALTSVEGMHFNVQIKNLFAEFLKSNEPFIKASAVTGISGLLRAVYNGVLALTGRDTRAFNTMEQAKAWLSDQK